MLLAGCGTASVGHLAYVSAGTLRTLDGRVGVAGTAPAWSHDGRWLAYLAPDGTLRVVGADGSGAHTVRGATAYAWSPSSDELAFFSASGEGLWLAGAAGAAHELAPGLVGSLAWSADGRTLAYSATLPYTDVLKRSDALYTVPAAGGTPTQRYVAQGDGIEVAAWLPDGQGLLIWGDPLHSASLAADGLGLLELRFGSPTPAVLATTLVNRSWLSFAGNRVLLVSGPGRELQADKQLAICDLVAATCQPLTQPEGTVSLDPAWSPNGTRMAFVRAARWTGPMSSAAAAATWNATRTLWLAQGDGSSPQQVMAAGTGASSPRWSADGAHILYLRDGAVWLLTLATGSVRRLVAGPVTSIAWHP